MPQLYEFEGQTYEFPDDVTETEALAFIKKDNAKPAWGDVLRAVPGEAKRQFARVGAGMTQVAADLLNSQSMRNEVESTLKFINKESEQELPRNMSLPQQGVMSGLSSAGVVAPAAVAAGIAAPFTGLATAGGALTTALGMQTTLPRYGELRSEGFGVGRSAAHSIFEGLVEKYTEYLPLKYLPKGEWTKAAAKFLGQEMAGEQLATALQDLSAKFSDNPDMTLGDFIRNQAVTAIATPVGAMAQIAIVRGVVQPAANAMGRVTAEVTGQKPADIAPEVAGQAANPVEQEVKSARGSIDAMLAVATHIDKQSLAAEAAADEQLVALETSGAKPEVVIEPNAKPVTSVEATEPVAAPTPPSLSTAAAAPAQASVAQPPPAVPGATPLPYAEAAASPASVPPATGQVSESETAVTPPVNPTAPLSMERVAQGTKITTTRDMADHTNFTVNRGKAGKVRVSAPNNWHGILYLLGRQLTRNAGKNVALYDSKMEEWRKLLVEKTGMAYQDVFRNAMLYYQTERGSIINDANEGDTVTLRTFTEVQREFPNEVSGVQAPVGVTIDPRIEQVKYSKDEAAFVQQAKLYLTQWQRMFAPQTRIVITGYAAGGLERDAAAYVKFYNGTFYIRLPSLMLPGRSVVESKLHAIYGLAHEFGHILEISTLHDPRFEAAKRAIYVEYEKMKEDVRGMTVKQFVEKWWNPAKVNSMMLSGRIYGVPADAPAMDLVKQLDGYRGANGYTLSVEEFLAEQFTRYINGDLETLVFPKATKPLWERLRTVLREFYDTVVKKMKPTVSFERWVNELSGLIRQGYVPPMPEAASRTWFETAEKEWSYTTKVLSRLPQKDVVKKATIIAEVNRPDVRQQERDLLLSKLHEFPGETVPLGAFTEKVQQEIMPLTEQTLHNTRYNTNGYEVFPEIRRLQGPLLSRWDDYTTTIWQVPVPMPPAPHFAEAVNYYAHTREIYTPSGEIVTEVQSDVEQQGAARRRLSQQIVKFFTELKDKVLAVIPEEGIEWNTVGQTLQDMVRTATNQAISDNPELRTLGRETVMTGILASMDRASGMLQRNRVADVFDLKIAENSKAEVVAPKALPKKWMSMLIRTRIAAAAKRDAGKVWFPGRSAVIAIEGWQQFYDLTKLLPSEAVAELFDFTTPGYTILATEELEEFVGISAEGVIKELDTIRLDYILDEGSPTDDAIRKAFDTIVKEEPAKVLLPQNESVLNNYEREVYPTLIKEYGAKRVVSGTKENPQGTFPLLTREPLEWYEVEITDEIAQRPITYFNTAERAVAAVGKAAGVPELPTSMAVFGGFLTNTLQLTQMAKLWPQLEGLTLYKTAMQGLHALKSKLLENPNDLMHKWHQLNPRQAELVETYLRDEVTAGVHWTSLVNDNGHWVHAPGPLFEAELKKRGINSEGGQHILNVKQSFLDTLQTMETVLKEQTADFYEGKNVALANAQMEELTTEFRRLRAVPYLPNARFGKYLVNVYAGYDETVDGRDIKKGELVYHARFESKREQKADHERLGKIFKNTTHVVSMNEAAEHTHMYSGLPQRFVKELVNVLNRDASTKLTEAQMDALNEVMFDETSAGKYFAKYLKVPAKMMGGASTDIRRVFAAYHWKASNAIARIKYNRTLQRAIRRVEAESRKIERVGGDAGPVTKVANHLKANFEHVMNPTNEWPKLRAFVSMWYLVGSAKTALMNMSSVPILTYPYLAARFGDVNTVAAMTRAMKDAANFMRNPRGISEEQQRVLEIARDRGELDQSFAATVAGVSDGGVGLERIMPKWAFQGDRGRIAQNVLRKTTWKILSGGMAPFRGIEQYNRAVTILAAYNLEVQRGAKSILTGDMTALERALEANTATQNEYAAWNQPRFMWGGASVFTLFYSFIQNMVFFMFGGDKGWLRAILVLAALGGLEGLPGMENIIDMLQWAYRKATGQHVDLRTEARIVAKEIGMNPDMVMHGLSHNMFGLGWDSSGSIGMGRIIPGTDAIFGIGKFEQRFVSAVGEVGGPVGSLGMAMLQALADDNPNAILRFDRMLPTALRNIERAYVAHDRDAWVDSRGRTLVEGAQGVEILGQALGFTPSRKSSKQEQLRLSRDAVEFYSWRRTNLMETYYGAHKSRDPEVLREARDAIKDYNDNVPYRDLRIEPSDLQKSLLQRRKMEAAQLGGRSPTKKYQVVFDNVMAGASQ